MKLAEQLLQTKTVRAAYGTTYPLEDAIDAETGARLQRQIRASAKRCAKWAGAVTSLWILYKAPLGRESA